MAQVLQFRHEPHQFAYTFGGAPPVARVAPGTVMKLWSEDAFNFALQSINDLSTAKVDLRYVNPQTGPFYVEGAKPGDTLVIHVVDLTPARDWGVRRPFRFSAD